MEEPQIDAADDDALEVLWDDLYEHTGDGHGIDCDCGSWYEVTILGADNAALVGLSNEYGL